MAQIGSIRPSLAQATQELTLAAANLNFDFTLIKFEAPIEYRGVGDALTPSRVREAEEGPLHITAARLGALFDGVCPDAPNLIKAYGARASEISREVSDGQGNESPTRKSNWIRSEYGGIDATSLWAAATSSKAALPVHLLACIIARMWTSSEAVSLWVELVAERKQEVISEFEKTGHISAPMLPAVRQEITRDHLAKWDASARAWLQTADKARERQHKQFLLIIKNLSIAIHQENTTLYHNVVSVWVAAMKAMDRLIGGTPYVVKDGSVLLGLSAWHIFPDMIVFNSPYGIPEIPMNDSLVKEGGILSLGISDQGRQEKQGVYWSLSLAHHKFYGDAVQRTRKLGVDGSRLSLNELVLVCLGSLLRSWSIPKGRTDNALRVIQAVVGALPADLESDTSVECNELNWKHVLNGPLDDYKSGHSHASLAISLGRRRPDFLPVPITAQQKPLFGLFNLSTLLFILQEPNRKIDLLRRLAARLPGLDWSNSIIVSFEDDSPKRQQIYATAFRHEEECPHNHQPSDRAHFGAPGRFHRWVQRPDWLKKPIRIESSSEGVKPELLSTIRPSKHQTDNMTNASISLGFEAETLVGSIAADSNIAQSVDSPNTDVKSISSEIEFTQKEFRQHSESFMQTSILLDPPVEANDDNTNNNNASTERDDATWCIDFDQDLKQDLNQQNISFDTQDLDAGSEYEMNNVMATTAEDFKKGRDSYLADLERELHMEDVVLLDDDQITNEFSPWSHDWHDDVARHSSCPEDEYVFLFGQRRGTESVNYLALLEHTAVYMKRQSIPPQASSLIHDLVSMEDILWCFEFDLVDPQRLSLLIKSQPSLSLIMILAAVQRIYKEPSAGGATITSSIIESRFDPPIFSQELQRDDWTEIQKFIRINQYSAIDLIGYFETGTHITKSMKGDYNILGLSGGDSIYVLTSLLCDPGIQHPDYSFSRILGNTGNAGFSILTTPSGLMVRKLDPGAWRLEPATFDGVPQDSFKHTSLHLGFTDWKAPLVTFRSVGERSADVNIIEAVISVRDSGRWVADVDIYKALIDGRVKRQEKKCLHDEVPLQGSEIASVENWDQVLDCADGSVVVRCIDNWVARLAVVSVLAQHGREDMSIVVCSKSFCWPCALKERPGLADVVYVY